MEQIPPMTVLLELLPADADDADPALITAIGTEVATRLRNQGETVQPVYKGQRGGELLLQILSTAWANKEIILSDLSSLVTLLTPMVLIAQHVKHAHSNQVGKEIAQQHPVAVMLEIKGMTLMVETTDEKDAEIVANRIAQQILAQPSPVSDQAFLPQTAKVQAHIPKRPSRKRR